MPTQFDLNPLPRTGQGPFGLVPGAIGLPPVYNDIAGVFPNLSGNLGALSRNIGSDLAGELDPETIAMLQNTAAQFGIGSGSPLSPFSGAKGLRQLGLTAEGQRAKGAQEFLTALPTIGKTLTVSPETQLEVANRNATLNAAPDPEKAAREAQRLFELYLARLGGGRQGGVQMGGGGGGGGGQPRNLNSGLFDSPWSSFNPEAVHGSRPSPLPWSGTGTEGWGTNYVPPQDLWEGTRGGFQGPEGGSVATPGGGGFQEWFNDPFLGGGGGMFGLGQGGNDQNTEDYWADWLWGGDPGENQSPVLPPDWEDF